MKRNNKQRSNTSDNKKRSNSKGQKNNNKRKGGPKKPDHFDKYRDTLDDYLKPSKGKQQQQSQDGEDFMFNKAPVVVRKQAQSSELQEKFRKQKRKQILKDKKQKFVELDSDEDPITYSLGKRQMQEQDLFDDQEGTFFKSMKYDFSSYFMLNKTQLQEIDKVPNMKLKEGAYVLGAISEKGPNSRYLEVNLGRSNKAYITSSETCEDDQKADLKNYKIGEYVQCVVMPNINPKNLQLSLRPSQLNKTLNFEDIFAGMTLQGTVLSEEDFGYKINFFTKDRCTGFFKTQDQELQENKCYMFTIVSTDPKKKLLQVSLHDPKATPQLNVDEDEMLGLDLSNLVKPGNLVSCVVTKILENGLVVKFNRVFFGYIFDDYLEEPLESYKIKQKLNARIILADIPNKQINLSQKKHHVQFEEIDEDQKNFIAPGQTFESGFTIKKCLYGGSYIVSFENKGHQELEGFIHQQHIEEDDQDKLKEGITFEKSFKIKEVNYFDQYPILTSQKEILQKKSVLWNQLTVGDIHKGTVISINQNNEQYQLMVALSDNVKGIVDHLNIQDIPSQQLPKYIKEGRKLMVRILAVDPEFKKLKLTLKQSFIKEQKQKSKQSNDNDINNEDDDDNSGQEDEDNKNRILSSFDNAIVGAKYQGYIVKALDFGFLVSFYNNITGLLTFKDLEDVNKLNRKQFKLGQTVKVYVTFVNKQEKKIGLSYSSKGINNHQLSNQVHKKLASTLQNIPSLVESDPEFKSKLSEVKVGETYEYILDKKATESQSDCLIVKLRNEKKAHKAILTLQHLSDYTEHYNSLFEYYKTSQANPKIKALIIGILDNGYALVTLKASLIEQKQYTQISQLKKGLQVFGYADYQTSKGVIVKLNEEFKGFAQLTEEEAQYSKIKFGDSLMLNVRKIDGEKLYFTISKKLQVHNSALSYKPFLGFLKEEFIINRKFINQNPKKWQKYKIGNYIQGKVSLVKEYGIILNITNTQDEQTNITGFITNENLKNVQKKNLKTEQILTCQILDIDYEQEILDLVCVDQKLKNAEELLKHHSYNLELVKKSLLNKKENSESLTCKVLLKKENYSILQAPENYFILAEQKIINEQNKEEDDDDEEEDEQDENNSQKEVEIKFMNLSILGKNCGDINAFNKANYLPIAELVPQKKQEKMDVEQQQQEGTEKKSEQQSQDPTKKISKALLSKLKIGGVITGTVKNVKATNVTIQISEKIFAKLHKNLMEAGATYKAGEEVTAKIVSIKKENHLQIEVTTQKAHLKLPSEQLCERILLPEKPEDFAEKYQDQVLKGIVKSVNTNSIHPLYVEFSNNHSGHVSCFTGIVDLTSDNIVSQLEKIKKLKEHYKPGQQLEFYVRECSDLKNMEVSLVKSASPLDIGAVRIAKVCGTSGTRKLRVQLDDQIFGSVDVVEVSDEWLANPLAKYSKNDLVPIRILNENKQGEFDCSIRESMLNKNNWEKALSPSTGTTLNFKKMFSEQQTNGDLRSRIFKIGQGSLKTGMLVIGYVNECNNNGCYIKVAYNLAVRAQLNELSDENIPNPSAYFYKNKLVLARIIKVKEDGKVDVSLRESVIQYGYSLDISKLKTGMTVQGIVTGHKQGKALVQLQKCKYSAKLSRKDHEVPEELESKTYFEAILKKGTSITAKIKKIKLEPYPKITLATQKKYFEGEKQEQEEQKSEQFENVAQLIASIKEIVAQNVEQEKKSADIQLSLQKQQEEEDENEQEYEDFDEEDSEEDELQKDILQKYANQDNEEQASGDSDEEEEEDDDEEVVDEEEDGEEEGDSDDIKSDQSVVEGEDEEDELVSNKKKSRRQKEIQKRRKEEKIREQEQKLLNENSLPESKDDFEKLILKNPNSSFVWIKYMAFAMESGIEEARTVADRALKVINFRNETEKLNVWTAYMNLEHNFGTEKELISVFQRATQSCKPKLVYFRLIDIYKKSEKYDLLFELARQMIKKFKHSSKVWLEYMKTIADIKSIQSEENNSQYDLKEILKRSLQCLKKKKHIIIMSHYARLMFMNNEPEKGRTTFDAILSNFPKRTDIWAVFLDMETKYGTPQTTRNLYERCISMSFKPRKMKFFFKRYLQYELQYGSNDKAEIVKQKAQEYVQSLIENDEDEEDNEQQENNEIEEQNDDNNNEEEQQEEDGNNDDDGDDKMEEEEQQQE